MRRVYLILTVIGLALLAYLLPVASLQLKLKDVSIERIKYQNRNYSVDKGQVKPKDLNYRAVLRLTAFYQWTKEDPLFYSPNLDVNGLKEAVSLLTEEHDGLQQELKESDQLYAVDFLNSLAQTSAAAAAFLKAPSDNLARELLLKQKETSQSLAKEAVSLANAVSEDTPAVVGLNIQTSPQIIKDDLGAIAQNSYVLEAEIKKRENCLQGRGGCQKPALDLLLPQKVNFSQQNLPPFLDLSLIYNVRSEELEQVLVRGPYRTATSCFGWGENFSHPEHYFYIKNSSLKTGLPYVDIKLATEVFFRKVHKNGANIGDEQLAEKGIPYIHLGSTNPYMCQNLNYLAEIAELDLFWQHKKPIFPRQTDGFLAEAKQKEDTFFKQPYPSYQELSSLADYYGYAYRLAVEKDNPNLQPIKEELLARYQIIKRKLGSLPQLLNFTTGFIISARAREALPQFQSKRPERLVFHRNYRTFYGLTLLPFTPAVWRLSSNLNYLDRRLVQGAVDPESEGYLSFSQAVLKYPLTEIQKWTTVNK